MKVIIKTATTLALAAFLGAALTPSASAADDAKAKKAPGDRFALLDADKDGKVTLQEYQTAMSKAKKEPKPTAEQIEKGFKRLDADKNGSLSKEEFAAAATKKKGAGAKPKTTNS